MGCFKTSKKTSRRALRMKGSLPLGLTSTRTIMSSSLATKLAALAILLSCNVGPLAQAAPSALQAAAAVESRAAAWRADSKDNLCGLKNPRHLTQPAQINYRAVLEQTPEMIDLRQRGISLDSAEGQILRERAVDRLRSVGSKLMKKRGYCSLWKGISHRDGRMVPDLTSELIAAL